VSLIWDNWPAALAFEELTTFRLAAPNHSLIFERSGMGRSGESRRLERQRHQRIPTVIGTMVVFVLLVNPLK
jgi:hypothetical protein